VSGHASAHVQIGLVTVDRWRELLETPRGLDIGGLMLLRGKLMDPEPAGLLPSPALELLRLDVDAALARHLGVPVDHLPGNAPLDPGDFG